MTEKKKKRSGRPRYQPTAEILARLGKISDAKLAQEAGVSPSVIRGIRVSLGIEPKRSDQSEAIRRLLDAGKTTKEIRAMLGVTRQYVHRLQKERQSCAGDGTLKS